MRAAEALALGTLDDFPVGVAPCHVLELGDRDDGAAGRPVAVVAHKRDHVVLVVVVANDQRRQSVGRVERGDIEQLVMPESQQSLARGPLRD